jgi:hypothetical protein
LFFSGYSTGHRRRQKGSESWPHISKLKSIVSAIIPMHKKYQHDSVEIRHMHRLHGVICYSGSRIARRQIRPAKRYGHFRDNFGVINRLYRLPVTFSPPNLPNALRPSDQVQAFDRNLASFLLLTSISDPLTASPNSLTLRHVDDHSKLVDQCSWIWSHGSSIYLYCDGAPSGRDPYWRLYGEV